jgi:leader peptidase (prepilin peptidase) / N-methyltransferase
MDMLNVIIPLLGLCMGTFVNQCIDWFSKDKSTSASFQACPSCGKPAMLYERIPLLGYVLSRGRCAQCDASISLRYPAVELAIGLLSLFLFRKYGLSTEFFAMLVLVLVLILVSSIDFLSKRAPHGIAIAGLSCGLILALLRKPLFFFQDALYGVVACGGVLLAIVLCCRKFWRIETIGVADAELLCVIGVFVGLRGAVFSLLTASLLGTLIGLPVMLARGRNAKYAISFGPLLSIGAFLFMCFGDRFIHGFLRFTGTL